MYVMIISCACLLAASREQRGIKGAGDSQCLFGCLNLPFKKVQKTKQVVVSAYMSRGSCWQLGVY